MKTFTGTGFKIKRKQSLLKQDIMFLTCLVSVDQPEKVNMTAEEDVDDDEDLPDFRTLQLNTENAHLFADHADGAARFSVIDFAALDSVVKIRHSLS